MLAALDLVTGKIFYRIRDRKRHREFLDLLKTLRTRWPGEKLYIICDNFSPHRHPTVRTWCAAHAVRLVFLPTYGSWLNWIETEFAALQPIRGGLSGLPTVVDRADVRVLLQFTNDPKANKERMHLDLETDDFEAEVLRLETLGATRWDHQQERGYDFWVIRDPWGNEFCVLQTEFPDLLARRRPWS